MPHTSLARALGVVFVSVLTALGLSAAEEPAPTLIANAPEQAAPQPVTSSEKKAYELPPAPPAGQAQVRLIAVKTDVAKRYRSLVPPLPFPPLPQWRSWLRKHEDSVHCSFEWCTESGEWFHGELRSAQFTAAAEKYRVGWGEFPGTAFNVYGVFIIPGRVPREKDERGKPVVVALDEEVTGADYRKIENELRNYAAKNRRRGEPGTGGKGEHNVGLGGPAYKPAQNSNTMVSYILRRMGIERSAPPHAVGWDTIPHFPYSSDADAHAYDAKP